MFEFGRGKPFADCSVLRSVLGQAAGSYEARTQVDVVPYPTLPHRPSSET